MDGFVAGVAFAAIVVCFLPTPALTPEEVKWAQTSCSVNRGLSYVRPGGYLVGDTRAQCANGAVFKMSD